MAESPTQEELDEQELREVEAGMREVLDLLSRRQSREDAGRALGKLRARRDETAEDARPAMHLDGARLVPTTFRTKAQLDLAEGLKTSIALHRHDASLEAALSRLCARHVAVLERILARTAGARPGI